jgi:hypothetical protein
MKLHRHQAPALAALLLLGVATALSSGWPADTNRPVTALAARGCVL